jgi:pimeloyl-ACP methyl ester carboxylesterase
MREIRVSLPELTVSALTWGPDDGPLAVLLHGFPDTAHTWRHLGPQLADAGWRAVAPFLRGYAPTDLPPDRSSHVAALVSDAAGLHAALGGGGDAVVVGHDWGAITANALAGHRASPYSRVVSMAVPPLALIRGADTVRALPRQLRNSWYIGFNQLPVLPELAFERLVRKLWRDWSPGYDAEDDIDRLLTALPDRRHRSAAIGYYRALVRRFPPPRAYRQWRGAEMRPPLVPTLSLHGADDHALDDRLAAGVAAGLPSGSEAHVLPDVGHFLHLEEPEQVGRLVLSFLA